MREKLKIMRENLRILKAQFDKEWERLRVKYYHEFALSVVAFGLTGIYLLYVYSRLVVFQAHSSTILSYNIRQAALSADLAGVFFALNPLFDIISSILLFGGCLWGVSKLFTHSLVKLSEVDLLPLTQRIQEIEKEGEEVLAK